VIPVVSETLDPPAGRIGLRELWKLVPWDLIGTAGLAISSVVFIVQLPGILDRSDLAGSILGYDLFVIVWLLIFTFFTRTTTWRLHLGYFLVGFYGVSRLVIFVGDPIADLMGTDSTLLSVLVAPVLEECVKALPLVVFLVGAARNRSRQPSILDLALLGFLVGSGFGLFETSLRNDGGTAAGGFQFPFGLAFPTVFFDDVGTIVVHTGWTMLVGLSLGFFWMWRDRAWAWLIPVAGLGVAIVDHASANLLITEDQTWLWWLTLKGWLPFILIVAGLASGMYTEVKILKQGSESDRHFARPGLGGFATRSGLWPKAAAVNARLGYLRSLNGAHYLMAGCARRGDFSGVSRQLPRLLASYAVAGDVPFKAHRSEGSASGSAATAPGTAQPADAARPAAWHPDPHGQRRLRWWDGSDWTDHVSDD
jgi:RsiW-degrading membrane proteinase PrsW (M82 family)